MRLYVALATLVMIVPAASAERRRVARVHVHAPVEQTQVRAVAPIVPPPKPTSLTLPQGVVSASISLEMSMVRDNALAPTSLAPDLSVGVFDRFTLSAITSGSALTGFRGSAGWGLCVTTEDMGCRTRFTAAGGEGLLSLTRGTAAFALNAGVIASTIEPTVHTDLKLGFKLKLSEGNVFALFQPSVWLALDDRYDRVVPHEHLLFLPISFWVKTQSPFSLGVGTGVKGPIKDFKDRMAIPLGIMGQFALTKRLSIGSSFVFGKLFGGSAVMDPGIDARVVQVWLTATSR
jgi:hypothetical protein